MNHFYRNAILFITALQGKIKNNCGLRNKIPLQAGLCYPLGDTGMTSKPSEIYKRSTNTADLKINVLITKFKRIFKTSNYVETCKQV